MEIECKIFGGSELLLSFWTIDEKMSVGKQNSIMALNIIRKEGLILVAKDLGGTKARKIIFDTTTGKVFLKRIKHALTNETTHLLT
ncbi:hypothetical protein [Desulfobacterium sp. N47]|uniref:Uncharacterized protein n=1 Tax=uncultured Desulfobacterium sp. TaxID=201089 RepID=E1Y8X9_9BACT|nr:hypothetical protein N47_A10520 [uncultured Desulfobacterium sp.]